MDYKVIIVSEAFHDDAARELQRKVKREILMGWKPLGGVSVSRSDSNHLTRIVLTQAMIKE